MKHKSLSLKKQIVQQYHDGESVEDLSALYNIPSSTIYSWIADYTEVRTHWGGHFTPREVNNLKKREAREREMLSLVQKYAFSKSDATLQDKMQYMEQFYGKVGTRLLCDAFGVNRATFLNYIKRNKRENAWFKVRRRRLESEIVAIYNDSHNTYGSQKITIILRQKYHETVSRAYVRKIMNALGIHGAVPETRKNAAVLAWRKRREKENLLKQSFITDSPNKVWVSDIKMTYAKDRRYYICVFIDLYSRKVIAWRVSRRDSTRFVTATFMDAYMARSPKEVVILHTDRGSPYISYSAEKLFRTHNILHSYSAKGNPEDNAVAEAFFSRLEAEELGPSRETNPYHSERDFLSRLTRYIDFYNEKRPHSATDNKPPVQFEKEYYAGHP